MISITIALYIKLNAVAGFHPILSAVNFKTQIRLEIQKEKLVWMFYSNANGRGFIISSKQLIKKDKWIHVLVDYNSKSGLYTIMCSRACTAPYPAVIRYRLTGMGTQTNASKLFSFIVFFIKDFYQRFAEISDIN